MLPRFARRQLDPTQTIVLSFAAVIAVGTLLLSLPASAPPGRALRFIDAFFTAVSATCVTGLVVVDTGTALSRFGQLVVLACIQIGGLGLMTFTTIFLVATGRRLAIADRAAILTTFHHTPTERLTSLIRYIVFATLAIETMGVVALASYWIASGRFTTQAEALYYAVFHAVSAFCNAGFGLYADSLTRFQGEIFVHAVFTTLIIAGGLGFLVGLELARVLRHQYRRRFRPQLIEPNLPPPRLSVHTRLVLVTTVVLLTTGTTAFFILERDGVLAGMTPTVAWMNAFFSAVTPRTAGFNTIPFDALGGPALLMTMALMIIGASPGSCGGGIKTSTFGLLLGYAFSRWRGHVRTHLFRRTVPQESVDKANAVVIASLALIVLASTLLMITETRAASAAESRVQIVPLVFETVSAFGTVGLSMGPTAGLTDAGKLIIITVMFVGRVGPLTLGLAISRRRHRAQYRYAEENVMIG